MVHMVQRQAEAVTSSWAAGPSGPGHGDLLINLGEGHPSGHGMLRLRLTLEGDRIVTADPVIGYVHRGAEKLFEARDYRQIIVLANRHDWLGAFASELGVVLAAERLAGIEVPPRGVWARTLLAELNRVLSHLAFLGSYPPEVAGGPDAEGGPEGRAARRWRAARTGGRGGGGGRMRGRGGGGGGRGRAGPGAAPVDHGGDLRRPDALHVQPGRRAEGGAARRLAGPGRRGRRRGARGPAAHRRDRARQRAVPRPDPGRGRAHR